MSINVSVQFIGLSNIWGSGLPFITNLLDHVDATGWVSSSNKSNQSWGGRFNDPTSMTNFPWGGSTTPVLFTCRGVLLVLTFHSVTSANIFFTAGIVSVRGASTIGFASKVWTGTSLMI